MAAEAEVPTAAVEAIKVPASEASERGRYAVYEQPDGSWKIATVGPLCENCSTCGCGSAYRDAIPVPPGGVQLLTGGGIGGLIQMLAEMGVPAPVRAMLGKVMGNGRG